MDKAGKKYWNDSWAISDIPDAVSPSDTRLINYVSRRFHKLFLQLFNGSETTSMQLLEVGAAKSAWLPYFANEFGFDVSGIDYSPIGCRMAKQVLELNGVKGEVVCADFFAPPKNMIGKFDVVVSFGVVEHFNDTSACLEAVSSFLKPGGLLITNIPNMVGCNGAIQKLVNKPIYEIHQLINPTELKEAHELSGLEVLECDYFMFTSFGVINLSGIQTGTVSWWMKKILLGFLSRVSMLTWLIEQKFGDFPPLNFTAPYVNCIARKR